MILKRNRQSQDGVGSILIIAGDVTKHSSHAFLSGLYSPTVTYPKCYKMLLFVYIYAFGRLIVQLYEALPNAKTDT